MFVYPLYKKAITQGYALYQRLPHNVVVMVFGVALCFFGGTYVASIAAIEAFRQLGGQKVYAELEVVYAETQLIVAASEADDKADLDNNGVADVDEMEASELAQHKVKIAMCAVREPARLQVACGALFTSYLAVLATLRLEFARTTAFALGLVEMAKFPVGGDVHRSRAHRHASDTHTRASPVPQIIRTVSPVVAASLGEELAHWTQTIIETTLTFIAVIFAWWLQVRESCLSLSPHPPYTEASRPHISLNISADDHLGFLLWPSRRPPLRRRPHRFPRREGTHGQGQCHVALTAHAALCLATCPHRLATYATCVAGAPHRSAL